MAVFAGQYGPEPVFSASERLLPGVGATVYLAGTSTLATLYASRTKAEAAANPTAADSLGNLSFWADPGRYDVVIQAATYGVTVDVDPAEAGRVSDMPFVPLRKFGTYAAGDDITALLQGATESLRDAALGEVLLVDVASTSADPFLIDGSLTVWNHIRGLDRGATHFKQADADAVAGMFMSSLEEGSTNIGLSRMTIDASAAENQHAVLFQRVAGLYLGYLRAFGKPSAPASPSGLINVGGFEDDHGAIDPTCFDVFWEHLLLEDGDNFGLQFGAVQGMVGHDLVTRRCYREAFGVEPGNISGTPLVSKDWAVSNLLLLSSTPKAAGSTATGVFVVTGSSGGTIEGGIATGVLVDVTEVIAADATPGVRIDGSGVQFHGQVRNANGAGVRLGDASYGATDCLVDVAVHDCNQGGHDSSSSASAGIGLRGSGTHGNTVRGLVRGAATHEFGYAETSSAASNDVDLDLLNSGATTHTIGASTTLRARTAAGTVTHEGIQSFSAVQAGSVKAYSAASTALLAADTPAGQNARMAFQTGGSTRMELRKSTTAESGSNVGSDLEVVARDDAGSVIGNCLVITRRNRVVTATTGFVNRTKAGVPSDADFTSTPPDGVQVIDTTNHRIYTRSGGAWRYVALT